MALDDYKVVLYRNQPTGWVAEVPSIPGCYALMATRAEALSELEQVFRMLEEEYKNRSVHPDGRGVTMPIHGGREIGPPLYNRILDQLGIGADEFRRLK